MVVAIKYSNIVISGQDSLVGKALDTGRKVLDSILYSTTKGVQRERLIISPCETIKIC
jgi:hypothetical protein